MQSPDRLKECLDIIETLMRLAYRAQDPERIVGKSDIDSVLQPLESFVKQARVECEQERDTPVYCALWMERAYRFTGKKEDIRNNPGRVSITDGEGNIVHFCGQKCLLHYLALRCEMEFYPPENVFADRRS